MESRIIVKGEEGDNSVIEFKPKKLGVGNVATAAKEFFNRQRESQNAFRLSEVISEITGLKNVERNAIEKRIEEAALEKLKEIQEEAYQKAHSLGVEEGK
ncbi:MAG: hypothetical protein KDD25_08340, partial [Bdellovibrionales bacterium]|nr:hypothetical protein [Bdellovibrionales bacterium]